MIAMVYDMLQNALGEHWPFWRKNSKPPEIQKPNVSAPPLNPVSYSAGNLNLLPKTYLVKGRFDYDLGELVYVVFITERGEVIKEFGIVNERMGDQYIIKLLISDPNDIAVVSVYALTGAGLS